MQGLYARSTVCHARRHRQTSFRTRVWASLFTFRRRTLVHKTWREVLEERSHASLLHISSGGGQDQTQSSPFAANLLITPQRARPIRSTGTIGVGPPY